MGVQYSNLAGLKTNEYLNRLIGTEAINENDPFWNQLLSFSNNFILTKTNSKLIDEGVSLQCQQFHQNNLKSGNYGTLIKVFCRLSNETRKMFDNHLIILQTTNALLLLRCFTKYIIEIENECALLEQINAESKINFDAQSNEIKQQVENEKQLSSSSSSSANTSPSVIIHKTYSRQNSNPSINENDSDRDSVIINNFSQKKSQNSPTLLQLVSCLFELCVEVPVQAHTYNLHLEALNTLIVILSVQMYTKIPTHESYIYEIFMIKMDHMVSEFVKALLKNVIQQMPVPPNMAMFQSINSITNMSHENSQRSLLSSVASGLWSVVTLGYGTSSSTSTNTQETSIKTPEQITTYLPSLPSDSSSTTNADTQIDCANRLIAWQSCHILLILSNHCTNESLYNPFRTALFHFTDTQDTPNNLTNPEPLPWFSIDYTKLFQMFTYTLNTDQYTLLLYMLLHRNQHFKMFILSRLNIDLLIIPILKVIYTAPERNSHHIYMALIILLILSEDDLFNKTIHMIPLKKLTWYTERSLSEISLGGLLILVIIRTIQFNMIRMRDKYLHTNCLAALANMSSKFHDLHPYVCQRINSLFNLLAKKRTKIINSLNIETKKNENEQQQNQQETSSEASDLVNDLSIIEELMRMVLEIINSCLTYNIHHNSNLVYSILYNKNLFVQFNSHPTFQDIIQNIDMVITSFSREIENTEDKSIENLKELIEMGVKQFSRERFKKFPELKFKYVEEDHPEDFFVPYVWSLVYKCSSLYWIDHSIKFFSQNLPDS